MTFTRFPIKTTLAALLLFAAPALAEGVPYAPCDYPGQYAHCPAPTPTPTINTNTNVAGAFAGAAAGAVSGSSSNASGGNASSVSHGGAGGNAKANGGKAVAHGGRQRQYARTGNISNVGNTNIDAVAIAPTMNPGQSMMGCTSGSLGPVSLGSCKHDLYAYIVDAEQRAKQGDKAGMEYLARSFDVARGSGVVDIRKDVIATAASAACQVVTRHANGKPKEVRAYPKPGRTKADALASCLSVRGLFLVSQ